MRNSFARGQAAHRQDPPAICGVAITDIRLASGQEIPAGTEVRVSDMGVPDAAGARVRLPGTADLVDLGAVPFLDGVVLLPDAKVFRATYSA